MPRWLTDEEQRVWRSFLSMKRHLDTALEAQLARDAAMPHAHYQILAMLSEAPERTLRMSDLATLVDASPSRLSHAVARLEERGWIERVRCPDDRRGILARLTDAGMTHLENIAPGHVAAVRSALFDRLDDRQIRQLGEIAETILRHPDR